MAESNDTVETSVMKFTKRKEKIYGIFYSRQAFKEYSFVHMLFAEINLTFVSATVQFLLLYMCKHIRNCELFVGIDLALISFC